MDDLRALWEAYAQDERPANIGDRVDGVVLAELDDEVQDVVGSYMGLGDQLGAARAARLGLALAEIVHVLPTIAPAGTQAYFRRAADLARATLEDVAGAE